jgi:nitrogen fixation protein NifZ
MLTGIYQKIISRALPKNELDFCHVSDGKTEDIMRLEDLDLGDVVYAAHPIINDISVSEGRPPEILAQAGTKGVIVMKGQIEASESRHVFWVCFEDAQANLGRTVGCWSDDLVATLSH